MDPAELLWICDDESSGSMMLMPDEADKRLVADAVPVMASRASTRFLRRFTSSPGREDEMEIDMEMS